MRADACVPSLIREMLPCLSGFQSCYLAAVIAGIKQQTIFVIACIRLDLSFALRGRD